MLTLFRRYRELLVVGALLVIPLARYLSSGHRGRDPNWVDKWVIAASLPIQRGLTFLVEGISSTVDGYLALRGARQERDACVAELSQTRAELNALAEAKAENERLKAALGYSELTIEPEITARVVGLNASVHFVSLRIDRGESEGVQLGMPVLTAEGVVGQVTRVLGHASEVMLITDPSSKIGAVVQRSRARATASGMGGGAPLSLDNVLYGDDVLDGDVLVTAGTDGVFPKGLVIGKIETRNFSGSGADGGDSIKRDETAMFLRAQVTPTVDLRRVEEVLLLPSMVALAPRGSEAR